jgi:hypothetical protein
MNGVIKQFHFEEGIYRKFSFKTIVQKYDFGMERVLG